MAAAAILDFRHFEFLTVGMVKGVELPYRDKFLDSSDRISKIQDENPNPRWRRPPSWKIEIIAISRPRFKRFCRNLAQCDFSLSKWRLSAILFFKSKFCRSFWGIVSKYVTLPNFVAVGQTVAKIWRFNGFEDGGRPPAWIFKNLKFYWLIRCANLLSQSAR